MQEFPWSADFILSVLRMSGQHCVLVGALGNVGRFAQKLEDCLTGFIELIVLVSLVLSRSCKWNHFGAHVLPFPVVLCGNV